MQPYLSPSPAPAPAPAPCPPPFGLQSRPSTRTDLLLPHIRPARPASMARTAGAGVAFRMLSTMGVQNFNSAPALQSVFGEHSPV